MKNSGAFAEKWNQLFAKKEKSNPQNQQTVGEEPSGEKGKGGLKITWKVAFFLRKAVLALPVVWAALKLAAYNRENLPQMVGINLQSTGDFAQLISRDTAVNVPLLITMACLALMVFSRKTVYPWLISIFTLILPVLLWLTNGYLG